MLHLLEACMMCVGVVASARAVVSYSREMLGCELVSGQICSQHTNMHEIEGQAAHDNAEILIHCPDLDLNRF